MSNHAIAGIPATASHPHAAPDAGHLALAVRDSIFAMATFAAKAAGGLAGGITALATAPLAIAATRGAARADDTARIESAGITSSDASAVESALELVHSAPEPKAELAPVAQAVRELER